VDPIASFPESLEIPFVDPHSHPTTTTTMTTRMRKSMPLIHAGFCAVVFLGVFFFVFWTRTMVPQQEQKQQTASSRASVPA